MSALHEELNALPLSDPPPIGDRPQRRQHTVAVEERDPRPLVFLKRANTVKPRAVKWAWKGHIPLAKLALFAGPAGLAKTTCALEIAATISVAGRFPDGTSAPLGSVVIWPGEDDVTDTIVPRLMAMGADLSKIFFVADVRQAGDSIAFDPSVHLEALARMATQVEDLVLIVIDPVMAAVRGNTDKAGDVRRGLTPVVKLAETTGAAVLGITHFTKGSQGRDPLERVTGSHAFGAVARVVHVFAKRKDEGDFVMLRVKSNIGPTGGGFAYTIDVAPLPGHPGIEVSRVRWSGPIDGDARDVLHAAESFNQDGSGSALEDAKAFLRDLLSDGPMRSKRIEEEARGAGHTQATIRRAREALRLKTEREAGPRGQWRWALPS